MSQTPMGILQNIFQIECDMEYSCNEYKITYLLMKAFGMSIVLRIYQRLCVETKIELRIRTRISILIRLLVTE